VKSPRPLNGEARDPGESVASTPAVADGWLSVPRVPRLSSPVSAER